MAVVLFIIGHWYLSLFCQSFFLHRYSAHKMFKMSKFWERFFFLMTYIFQGSSYFNPRAYAIMHRMHHAYSDTSDDPHSPLHFRNVFRLMWRTKKIYTGMANQTISPQREFVGNYPEWKSFEPFAESWYSRILWAGIYFLFYYYFATAWWMYLFLPVHFLMGPIHGAIVNWCGHKYGYSNFNNDDNSKNSLIWDVLLLGELFQNNHHKHPNRSNFAIKWFEFDPTYPIMKCLNLVGIIKLRKKL